MDSSVIKTIRCTGEKYSDRGLTVVIDFVCCMTLFHIIFFTLQDHNVDRHIFKSCIWVSDMTLSRYVPLVATIIWFSYAWKLAAKCVLVSWVWADMSFRHAMMGSGQISCGHYRPGVTPASLLDQNSIGVMVNSKNISAFPNAFLNALGDNTHLGTR